MGFEWVALKNYKRHYVCLDCQKGFKRASKQDMKNPEQSDLSDLMERYYAGHSSKNIIQYIDSAFKQMKAVCPQCREAMIQVSHDFEVPRQRDTKAWKELRKRLHHRTLPVYDSYIHWHRLQLQQASIAPATTSMLQDNLEKLAKVKSDTNAK